MVPALYGMYMMSSMLSLQKYNTRNSRFNLPPLDWMLKYFYYFLEYMTRFNVAPAELCIPRPDFDLKNNSRNMIFDSYG